MITTADFKKQIGKSFGEEMRAHGYKGAGFVYKKETEDFLIAIYIDSGKWGGNCSVGFAIHPKVIDKEYYGKKDLSRLKIYEYEFKFSLDRFVKGGKWMYSDDEATNLATLAKILKVIKSKAFPIIDKFNTTPNVFDQFQVAEMDKTHTNWKRRTGISINTTDLRFAWVMTLMFEKKNPKKAKQFAKWALSQPDNHDSDWFGNKDFRRVLAKK